VLSVSFVIPALNESRLLSDLLESISSLVTDERVCVQESIVVDAHSTDQTVAVAKKYNCKVVQAAPGNVSQSRNTGASEAEGSILAFIDADCELPENWLLEVADQFSSTDVVAVGVSMGLAVNPGWIERTWFELAHKSSAHNEVERVASEVNWLPTFNLAVRKSSFQAVGGFDETLTTCEDFELGFRLRELGRLLRLELINGVVHKGESKKLAEFFKREGWRARGEAGLLKKHMNSPKVVLSFLLPGVVVTGVLLALLLLLLVLAGVLSFSYLTVAIALGVLPVLLLVLRRRVAVRYLLPAWFLLNIYFFAKAFGTWMRFERVDRL